MANVCDPNYTFVVKAAKAYLPTGEGYAGVHGRLAEVAAGFRSGRGASSSPTNGH